MNKTESISPVHPHTFPFRDAPQLMEVDTRQYPHQDYLLSAGQGRVSYFLSLTRPCSGGPLTRDSWRISPSHLILKIHFTARHRETKKAQSFAWLTGVCRIVVCADFAFPTFSSRNVNISLSSPLPLNYYQTEKV